MKHRTVLGIGAGLVVVVVGLLISYQTLYAPTVARKSLQETSTSAVPFQATYTSTYSKGTYTISGTVTLPNQCHRVEASGALESGVVRVLVTIPADGGICLEIQKEAPFSVSVEGEEGATTEVLVNGVLVPSL